MKRKTIQSVLYQKKSKPVENGVTEESEHCFLAEVKCYIHPANFGVGRLNLFQNLIRKYGGKIIDILPCSSETASHIIFEETVNVEKLNQLIDTSKFQKTVFVKCTWLTACVKAKKIVETKVYEITPSGDQLVQTQESKISQVVVSSEASSSKQETGYLRTVAVGKASLLSKLGKEGNQSDVEQTSNISNEFVRSKTCVSVVDAADREDDQVLRKSVQVPSEIKHEQTFCKQDTGQYNTETENFQGQKYLTIVRETGPKDLKEKFACARPSSSKEKNLNSHITAELEKLATAYKSKKDTWRALGYQKAISAIRNFPKEITTREEALGIPGVGERLADKVAEIIESGKLRKVSEVCEGEEAETLKLFMGVWGAGPTTAQNWYTQGFRTLEDLHTNAVLTRHQQIGLKLYDDINSRIPRNEVLEIEEYVRSAALSINKGLIIMVCGSYRRGKSTCGDVDVLITHPDGHSHQHIFKPLLTYLKEIGFLTDDLVSQEDNGNQKKYLGVCKLPGEDRKHRRLDIIVVPHSEFGPALMYFTGSAHFNRSMRLLAIKMGMSLSEHGLRAGIVRQGREKLSEGHLLDTPTEESIFTHLGLEYRPPQERDH